MKSDQLLKKVIRERRTQENRGRGREGERGRREAKSERERGESHRFLSGPRMSSWERWTKTKSNCFLPWPWREKILLWIILCLCTTYIISSEIVDSRNEVERERERPGSCRDMTSYDKLCNTSNEISNIDLVCCVRGRECLCIACCGERGLDHLFHQRGNWYLKNRWKKEKGRGGRERERKGTWSSGMFSMSTPSRSSRLRAPCCACICACLVYVCVVWCVCCVAWCDLFSVFLFPIPLFHVVPRASRNK